MKLVRTWTKENNALLETLFHVANGYLGVRNAPEEGGGAPSIRGTYVNGFYELQDVAYGEKLYGFPETKQTIVNLPDSQTVRICAGGIPYSMFAPETVERVLELDTQTGICTRTALWRHPAGDLRVRFIRLASLAIPNLFILRLELTSVDFAGTIHIESSLNADVTNSADPSDPRLAAEPLRCLALQESRIEGDEAALLCQTKRSGLTLACRAMQGCSLPGGWEGEGATLTGRYEGNLRPGESIRLNKFVVYTDSLRCEDPAAEAGRLLSEVRMLGGVELLRKQKNLLAAWAATALPELLAPDPLPEALDFGLYQLLQSTGADGVGNVAAKGLSGEGYEGHTFWDSDVYVFPFFLWTRPEQAKALLHWRYRMLPAARQIARSVGLARGALYPWRTIHGEECSAFFPAGTAQAHINGDVAHSFLQYYRVTGDLATMAEEGAEVLVETARMWMEHGVMHEGEFRIDCVTGPDEYTCCVDNNFYTNAAAQANLRGAVEIMGALRAAGLAERVIAATGVTPEEEARFAGAADAMRLPRDERLGISPQDDSFLKKKPLDFRALPKEDFPLLLHYHPLFLYRHQVCKQADTVLAHLLFPKTADLATQRASFAYYDAVTTHDSSLSACVFATQAARLGDLSRAAQGFCETAVLDLLDTQGNTRDGLHTANLGGAYLCILLGFAGVRATQDGLSVDPVLPEGWAGYRLPITYRGRRLLVCCDPQGASLRLLSGEALRCTLCGKPVTLQAE